MPLSREEAEKMMDYRKKNFAVKLQRSDQGSYADILGVPERVLSVTHNGYQWTSISLTRREAVQIASALRRFVNSKWHNENPSCRPGN